VIFLIRLRRLAKVFLKSEAEMFVTAKAGAMHNVFERAPQRVQPVWIRSFPIAKESTTLGEHLRNKRFGMGIRQEESEATAAPLIGPF
jgi:hypothetical protein